MPPTKGKISKLPKKVIKKSRIKAKESFNVQIYNHDTNNLLKFNAFEKAVKDTVKGEQLKLINALKINMKDNLVDSLTKVSIRKIWNSLLDAQISKPRSRFSRKSAKTADHILHMYWCGICGKKLNLVKCSLCSIAYHRKCSKKYIMDAFGDKKIIDLPMDFCPICLVKGKVESEAVVWHKLKTFPWWPAKILASTENTGLKQPPNPFYRPVYYYGTKNYGWAHEKQLSLFNINYDAVKDKSYKLFQKAVNEAQSDFNKSKES